MARGSRHAPSTRLKSGESENESTKEDTSIPTLLARIPQPPQTTALCPRTAVSLCRSDTREGQAASRRDRKGGVARESEENRRRLGEKKVFSGVRGTTRKLSKQTLLGGAAAPAHTVHQPVRERESRLRTGQPRLHTILHTILTAVRLPSPSTNQSTTLLAVAALPTILYDSGACQAILP